MSLFDAPFNPMQEAALVTGAGNGIGRAIAQALVGEGVKTVFADIREDTVTAAAKASPRPDLAMPWVGDLADPAAPIPALPSLAKPGRRFRAVNLMPGFHLPPPSRENLSMPSNPDRSCS